MNRENPVGRDALRAVEKMAGDVVQEADSRGMLLFLKLLSQFYFHGAKQIFFRVLNELRALEPGLAPYFKDVVTDEDDEGPILTPLAIGEIFKVFESEFGYPSGLLDTAAISELPLCIDSMIHRGPNGMIRGWIVHNDRIKEDPHVVPVFAIKTEGRTHVFIFDSLGHTIPEDGSESPAISAALEEMIAHFSDSEKIDRHLAVYSYKLKRQNGWTLDCVTFSMLDLKHLMERHLRGAGNLVEFYSEQEEDHQPRLVSNCLKGTGLLPVFELDTLPPEMMKGTQSLRAIKDYGRDAPVITPRHVPSFERYSPSWQVVQKEQTVGHLLDTANQFERMSLDERPMNLYVQKKRFAYTVYLIGNYLKEKARSEEQTLTHPRVSRVLFAQQDDDSPSRPQFSQSFDLSGFENKGDRDDE